MLSSSFKEMSLSFRNEPDEYNAVTHRNGRVAVAQEVERVVHSISGSSFNSVLEQLTQNHNFPATMGVWMNEKDMVNCFGMKNILLLMQSI